MRKIAKLLSLPTILSLWIIIVENFTFAQTADIVPDYYYANYRFISDINTMWDIFNELKNYPKLHNGDKPEQSKFEELTKHFNNIFPYLTKDYADIYSTCTELSENLSKQYNEEDLNSLIWEQCYKNLNKTIRAINSDYTVNVEGELSPTRWKTPLLVTFKAKDCKDPSWEIIPSDSYFWYYTNENWVDTLIWRWITVNYTFKEPGTYVVHLVVRSSNVDKWIMDWEKLFTVKVQEGTENILAKNENILAKNENTTNRSLLNKTLSYIMVSFLFNIINIK